MVLPNRITKTNAIFGLVIGFGNTKSILIYQNENNLPKRTTKTKMYLQNKNRNIQIKMQPGFKLGLRVHLGRRVTQPGLPASA